MKPDPIQQELDRYVAAGKIDPQLRNSVRRLLLARGKDNLTQAVADVYHSQFGADKHYEHLFIKHPEYLRETCPACGHISYRGQLDVK